MSANTVCRIVIISFLAILLQFGALPARAAFYMKKAEVGQTVSSQATGHIHRLAPPDMGMAGRIFHLKKDAPKGDDSYKGIIAIAAGCAGLASIIAAAILSGVGGLFVGFLFGIVAIVFGALPKKSYKSLGRAGLVMGIIEVVLTLLFLVVVLIALASFT